jgi:hypothetical protein
MKIKLGAEYEDKVSGFRGIATARYEFLNKCVRVQLTARQVEEGKKPLDLVFDREQLVKVGKGIRTKAKKTGGGHMEDLAPRE